MKNSNTASRPLTSAFQHLYAVSFLLGGLLLQGCQKDAPSSFLGVEPPRSTIQSTNYDVRTLRMFDRAVDVVWVVDNSGSMDRFQQALADNADIFMREFRNRGASWQVGLITTTDGQAPVLGFGGRALDERSINPLQIFQAAVRGVGIGGSGIEKTVTPFRQAVARAPNYLRSNVPLILVILSDAEEQSSDITIPEFYDELLRMKGMNASLVKVFGILGPHEWCGTAGGETRWSWFGSRYKQLIDLSSGVAVKLCDPIGNTLSALGRFTERATSPRIPLNVRPKLSTIRIKYQGVDLPGGEKEDGGKWYYDYEVNAIFFYDLEFAPGDNEAVEVIFRPEDGLPD
jgi:hypothetical protein